MRLIRSFAQLSAAGLAAALFAAVAPAQTPASFEGVITMNLVANGQATEAQYSVKGDKIRMDVSAGGMQVYMLMNSGADVVVIVLPGQQMFMEQSMGGMPGIAAAAEKKAPTMKWTGKKEMVAGHECEHVLVTEDGGGQTGDVCMAKDLGSFKMPGGPMARGGQPAWQTSLAPGMFPLKVQMGADTPFEVTKIEKKSLETSVFDLPQGYTKMQMPMGRPPLN